MQRARAILLLALLLSFTASLTSSQTPDLSGNWAGTIVTGQGSGGLEFALSRDSSGWKAAGKMRIQGQEIALKVEDLKIEGDSVSVTAMLDQTRFKLAGKADGDKLTGTLEAFLGDRKISDGTFNLVRGGQMPALQQTQTGGQVADPNFDAKVVNPAYKKNGPQVLFDEAHNNFHISTGRYKPFADLITNDGYQITPNKEKFSPASLKRYDILVISNALGHPRMGAAEASNPAFTDQESDAVRDWVKAGGALLLIADHAPMGSANQILGDRFGVNMSKMYTADEQNYDRESNNQGFIIYTRESGRLADHAITRGRNDSERVNKIIAFTGQSLKGPPDSFAFMKLADTAVDVMPNTTPVSAAGRAQGLLLFPARAGSCFWERPPCSLRN